ncbi:MAG: S8 family serine peptidase [Chloroflexota bacterium]
MADRPPGVANDGRIHVCHAARFIRHSPIRHSFIRHSLGVGLVLLALVLAGLWPHPSTPPALAQGPVDAGQVESGERSRVVVVLQEPGAQAAEIAQTQAAVLADLPGEDFSLIHQYQTVPGLVGEVTPEGLATLLDRPEVALVALDAPVEAALTESAALIGVNTVRQNFGLTGAGVTVALLDTGLDLTQPDLAGRIVAQHCFNRDGACPPQDTPESDVAQDENGHGTHVAGIIAGQGTEAPPGLAPGVNLVAVRVLAASGSGFTSDVLAGLDWIIANQDQLQVDIVNLSLGGGRYSGACDEADANTVLYAQAVAAAHELGITLFAAAGNSGLTNQMMLPACLSGVVAVGSTYDADVGPFSWGGCTDPQTAADQVTCASNSSDVLDLFAPGAVINSTALGGGQGPRSGTSMSTAHASAVAALLLEAGPQLTPVELETVLKETGAPITDPRTGRVTPRLDALAAVTRLLGAETVTISGTIWLQGRAVYSGTTLYLTPAACPTPFQVVEPSSPGTLTAVTNNEGYFEFAVPAGQSYGCLQAVRSGYLAGQRAAPPVNLGHTLLPAGEVTADNSIDILDLALIAHRFHSHDALADVNADGVVDILDLVLAAANYKRRGPVLIGPEEPL